MKLINKFYEKSQLGFALAVIGVYCVVNSIANVLSEKVGLDSSINAAVNLVLTAVLLFWIRKSGLTDYYGLCKSKVSAGAFLWYIPLIVFVSHNLWGGIGFSLSVTETVFYILSMLCVGFLEEVIFRGFLFRAMVKSGLKSAAVVSAVTFGVGHILNLFNGSNMEIFAVVVQIVGAVICGFMFVVIFIRGGSLVPCILAHGVNNCLSAFGAEGGLSGKRSLFITGASLAICGFYTLYLLKAVPKREI